MADWLPRVAADLLAAGGNADAFDEPEHARGADPRGASGGRYHLSARHAADGKNARGAAAAAERTCAGRTRHGGFDMPKRCPVKLSEALFVLWALGAMVSWPGWTLNMKRS